MAEAEANQEIPTAETPQTEAQENPSQSATEGKESKEVEDKPGSDAQDDDVLDDESQERKSDKVSDELSEEGSESKVLTEESPEMGESEEMEEQEPDDVIDMGETAEMELKKVNFLDVEDITIGGDFTKTDDDVDVDSRYQKVFDLDLEEEEEEEAEVEQVIEEEKEEEEEEEVFVIDRITLCEEYHHFFAGYDYIKVKNNFLQKKMVEYFSKRKMEHIMKEDANYEDNYVKYCKHMDTFADLKLQNQKLKDDLKSAIYEMKVRKNNEKALLNEIEAKLYVKEIDVGTGLILAKTGKEVPEKLVERLVKNQMAKIEEMSSLRLLFIKIRDKIAEMESACERLDKIGEHYTLMDYEQLKIERRNHTDKIEERDEELSRLRLQCRNAIQCLAHTREKLAAVQTQIYMTTHQLSEVEDTRQEIRETLNENKKQRDKYRALTLKVKEDAGLLTKPKLLRDMEDTMHERDRLEEELQQLRTIIEKYKNQIENVKEHIKKCRRSMRKTTRNKLASTVCSIPRGKVFKGRPSLMTINESICTDFENDF